MPKLIAGCLGLAALSLLLPSQPAYDPMAWLVWGREIAHGGLDTAGGSSWKPLPVLFTVALAPLSPLDDSIPPALWMVVARTGALLALALAFRLVFRLAGGGPAGAAGGAAAAAALFLLPDWLQFVAHGSEAPWAVALMLWAVERHMDGARRGALVLGVLACLLRPELITFLGVYAAWLWFAEPRLRSLSSGLLLLGVVAWVAPDWIGSGNPLMTEQGFSGNPRYVVPALALACVLAGVGLANLLQAPPAVAVPAAVALLVLGPSFVDGRVADLRAEARQVGARMEMHTNLARAVDRLGGPAAVTAMGTATTNRAFHSRLAWELKVPIDEVESVANHRVIFRSLKGDRGGKVFFVGRAKVRRTLAVVGDWRVYRRERISFPLTARLQGIHNREWGVRSSLGRVVTR